MAIKKQTGEAGSSIADRKFKFGRSANRSRTRIKIPLNGATAPKHYTYDRTKKAWEQKTTTHVYLNMLQSTAEALKVADADIVGGASGRISSKVWKAKVLAVKGTVEVKNGVPSGVPNGYTHFNLAVPAWMTIWDFAKCVYKYFEGKGICDSDGKADEVDQVIAFVSPSGRTYSCSTLKAMAGKAAPPSPDQGESAPTTEA